jgi:hypothetical protein
MFKKSTRKQMTETALLALCLTLVAGGAIASDLDSSLANGGIRVGGSELTALHSDRTWSGMTAKGTAVVLKFAADGTGVLTFKNEDQAGKWRVEG